VYICACVCFEEGEHIDFCFVVAIQTHHRFSPQDLRWDFRCLWLVFSPKLLSKQEKSTDCSHSCNTLWILRASKCTTPQLKIKKKTIKKQIRFCWKTLTAGLWNPLFFWNAIKCKLDILNCQERFFCSIKYLLNGSFPLSLSLSAICCISILSHTLFACAVGCKTAPPVTLEIQSWAFSLYTTGSKCLLKMLSSKHFKDFLTDYSYRTL